jgi:16S rRNA (guanine527-N7)-methyltransferase
MSSKSFRDLLSTRATAAGLSIDAALTDRLEAYFRLLAQWNSRINLTGFSLNEPSTEAIDRLLVEPVSVAQALNVSADVWFDLGSGGGSPAFPMQLCRPAKLLVLVESRARKAAFLREVARELRLDAVEVEVIRIESITASFRLAGSVDLVTVRAVKPSDAVFNAFRTLLRRNGQAVLLGSPTVEPRTREGFKVVQTVEVSGHSTIVLAKT